MTTTSGRSHTSRMQLTPTPSNPQQQFKSICTFRFDEPSNSDDLNTASWLPDYTCKELRRRKVGVAPVSLKHLGRHLATLDRLELLLDGGPEGLLPGLLARGVGKEFCKAGLEHALKPTTEWQKLIDMLA